MLALRIAASVAALSLTASAQTFTGTFSWPPTTGFVIGIGDAGFGNLLFVDRTMQTIGQVTRTGTVLGTSDISANTGGPVGVTVIPDPSSYVAYVTDTIDDDVDSYLVLGPTSTIHLGSFSIAGFTTFPEGITYSPVTTNLYIVNGLFSEVAEFTTNGTHIATFPLNGSSVDGIAHDPSDNTFWIYDSGTDSIRHYDANFTELSAAPGTAANGVGSGEGVAVSGSNIYVSVPTAGQVAVFAKPVFAEVEQYGMGCPQPNDFYEQFFGMGNNDLSGSSITIAPNGSGITVTSAGSFDNSFSNNLFSGDDSLFSSQPLGFTATFPGLGTTSSIDIDSNGRIGVGLPSSDFTQSVSEFLGDQMLAVCWDDFNPSLLGADVYFDTDPGVATVTWFNLPQFGQFDSNTFQVKLYADGRLECNYSQVADGAIVGLSEGLNGSDPGSIDLSSTLPFSRAGGGTPMVLSGGSLPIIGQNFDLVTSNIPPTAAGGGIIVGFSQLQIPVPGAPLGCDYLSTGDLATLPLLPTLSLLLPNNRNLLGLSLTAQSIVVDPTLMLPNPSLYSNGLRFTIGDS